MAESITDPNPKSKAKAKDTKGASEHVHSCLLFKANGFPYKSVFYEKLQLELAGRIESLQFWFPGCDWRQVTRLVYCPAQDLPTCWQTSPVGI